MNAWAGPGLAAAIAAASLGAGPAVAGRSAAEPATELAELIDGREAGAPVACVPYRAIDSSRVIPGIGIVYRAGGTLYLNRTQDGAAGIGRDDVLVTRTIGAQLCRLDVVEFVDRNTGIWTGFTALGDFVPYRSPD